MKSRSMLTVKAALLGLALVAAVAVGQTEVWVHHYSGNGFQNEATAIARSPDATMVVTGFSVGPDFTRDIYTIKIRQGDGGEVWAQRWAGASGSRDEAYSLAVDNLGNVFVAGRTNSAAADTDFVVIKYSSDGTELWTRTYDNSGVDVARVVAADQSGGCFVTGYSNAGTGNGNLDYLTIHYDAAGGQRWVSRLNGTGGFHDYPTGMMLGDAGYLYLTGYSWGGSTPQYDYLTLRLDTLDGDTVWTRRYDGTAAAPKSDYAHGITQDDSQYVYVTGRAGEQGTWYDATTIKYTPAGTAIWVNRFDAGWLGTDGGGTIQVDKSFNVYVGGIVLDAVNDMYDFLTFRINQDNTNPWFHTYDGGVEDDDSLTAMVVDDRGNVCVTGWFYSYSDLDWMTIKYDPNGAKVWSAVHQTQGDDDQSFGIVMDERGDYYITGFDFAGPDENYCTVKYTEDDVGAFRVVMPQDSFRLGATVVPRAWVRNYSSATSRPFAVRCEIGGFYFDAQSVDTIPASDSVEVTFSPWLVEQASLGSHVIECYAMLDVDKERTNDTVYSLVAGVPVWERLPDVPAGPRRKTVMMGGSLGYVPDSLVFAFKGNNTDEFYIYNANQNSWSQGMSIPFSSNPGSSRKRVKVGAQLAGDTSGNVYAFKGNSSFEFWQYSVAGRTWIQKPDYPRASGKKLKAGSNLVYVPQLNALYGNKGMTYEFHCYDIAADTWVQKRSVPTGPNGNKKPKDGTVMAYDGVGTIYLLKGGTYEFYGYSIAGDSWYERKPIRNPVYTQRVRKMKKGAAAAFDSQYNFFYALKGGKGGEFWFYDPARDTWVEPLDDSFPTVPRVNKPPYTGADLCYGAGKIFALRGNKTNEFWRYNANFPLGYNTSQSGTQSGEASIARLRLSAAPNPFVGRTQLRYSLPGAANVRLALYDATGRLVRVVSNGRQEMGPHTAALNSDGLAAGVYLLRLDTGPGAEARSVKLVVR